MSIRHHPLGGGKPQDLEIRFGKERQRAAVVARTGLQGVYSLGVILAPETWAGKFIVWHKQYGEWQIVASLHHAIRQSLHILSKHGFTFGDGERSAMAMARHNIRTLHSILHDPRIVSDTHDLRTAMEQRIEAAAVQLGFPRNAQKLKAVQQLRAIARGRDSLGRENPSAALARAVSAYEEVINRLEGGILRIDPFILQRQAALINLAQLVHLTLFSVDDTLRRLLQRDGLWVMIGASHRTAISDQLAIDATDIERIDFHPYRNACRAVATDLRLVAKTIHEAECWSPSETRRIRTALIACRKIVRIKTVQMNLERLIYLVTVSQYSEKKKRHFPRTWAWRTLTQSVGELLRIDDSGQRYPTCLAAAQMLHRVINQRNRNETGKLLRNERRLLIDASAIL